MSTRLASFSTLLALFFFLAAPASLTAQVRPDQFDIIGLKLGMPGGPELKKMVIRPQRQRIATIIISYH